MSAYVPARGMVRRVVPGQRVVPVTRSGDRGGHHHALPAHATFRPGEGPQEGTPEFDAEMARWGALNEEMRQAGVAVGASGLHQDATTTVRTKNGEVVVT